MPHIHEKIDFCVEVFIVHQDKVLLRMHDKYHEWLSVGGHIELDEDPVEAAHREVKEEVGLEIELEGNLAIARNEKYEYRELLPPRHMSRHRVNATHEHIVFIYFAKSSSNKVVDSHSDHERAETRWVTLDELNDMNLLPDVRFYAEEALKELGSK
ncbi:NUDIX domain-containing protein [Patescibacteria group bacterium]|nr:NUDIX domain-containing protein [Patescibacteria group bacterium]